MLDHPSADAILLTTTRVLTYTNGALSSNASGFFFERDGRLYLVTNRHVVIDPPTGHAPDRLDIDLHTDATNLARAAAFTVPLYCNGQAVWRQGTDSGGEIDVAVLELHRSALPRGAVYRAFGPAHLPGPQERVEVGSSVLILGFPLGFHDALHHMPIARQAVLASAYGLRFQGQGFFLTDARTHRGTSGAPVVMRVPGALDDAAVNWKLLGVHSARMDMGSRDLVADEALGLNCAWYADILLTLTAS